MESFINNQNNTHENKTLMNEKLYSKNISKIIKTVRSYLNLSIEDLSKKVGVSFETIKKLENDEIIPSAGLWITLCEALNIPIDSIRYGFIDFYGDNSLMKDDYKLPIEYSNDSHFYVRGLIPFIEIIETKFDENIVKNTLEKMKVHPYFILKADNKFNLNFLNDFIHLTLEILTSKTKKEPEIIIQEIFNEYTKLIQSNPYIFGRTYDVIQNINSTDELIAKFINLQTKFNTLFQYEIEKLENNQNYLLTIKIEHQNRHVLENILPNTLLCLTTCFDTTLNSLQFLNKFNKKIIIEQSEAFFCEKDPNIFSKLKFKIA
jgi:transcriptional regulator with XRE-family HTH domain